MVATIPVPDQPLTRPDSSELQHQVSFFIPPAERSYKYQYANIYFLRLTHFKPILEKRAHKRWNETAGHPTYVDRVLDVSKGKLCYIIGTVYVDMKLKPNVLEDIAKDRSLQVPIPTSTISSENDTFFLEDDSGRITLVGEQIRKAGVVTGVVIAALGIETPEGEFEVADVCFAGYAPQSEPESKDERMDVDDPSKEDSWVAFVSGLDIGGTEGEAQTNLLVEYLLGEQGGSEDQLAASKISRLVILGNSLAPVSLSNTFADDEKDTKKLKRYGYDTTSFTPHPTHALSDHLAALAPALPVHILPGPHDPSGSMLPQQPFPTAMFGPSVSDFETVQCETNPVYLCLDNQTLLCHSGQPIDDVMTYIPPNLESSSVLDMVQRTLRWQHMAPTCPDTLWCHPYFQYDPFILHETPNFYMVGGQSKFATRLVDEGDIRCRIVLVPKFSETGTLVCINLKTAKYKLVHFGVQLEK